MTRVHGSCWLTDRTLKRSTRDQDLTPEQLQSASDQSPGVLMASGYIAGGAIAGIGIAFVSGALVRFDQSINDTMTAHNPLFNGPYSDALSLLPFAALMLGLYLAGRVRRAA